MGTMAVIERLKEFGRTQRDSNAGALDQKTETLVWQNPFAFLIAVAFDRGMPWEKAWRIPTEIDQRGLLDPVRLAAMDEPDLAELLDGIEVRPRWGTTEGAKTLSDAARLVVERFGGDAHSARRFRLFRGSGTSDRRQARRASGAGVRSRRAQRF